MSHPTAPKPHPAPDPVPPIAYGAQAQVRPQETREHTLARLEQLVVRCMHRDGVDPAAVRALHYDLVEREDPGGRVLRLKVSIKPAPTTGGTP